MKRRNILKAVGASATIGLAGCSENQEGGTATDEPDDSESSGSTPAESGSNGSSGEETATPAAEERVNLRIQKLLDTEAGCNSEKMLYYVKQTTEGQYVLQLEGFYKSEQECAFPEYLDPEYDGETNHLTFRVGAGDEFTGSCKGSADCGSGEPILHFTKEIEVTFDDLPEERSIVDTFSVVFEYPDGSETMVVEGAKMEQDTQNF